MIDALTGIEEIKSMMKRCRGRLHDNMQINSHSHSIQLETFIPLTSSEKEDVKMKCADRKAEVY